MNIELDEVVVQDVSDDALELASGGAQGGVALLPVLTAEFCKVGLTYSFGVCY